MTLPAAATIQVAEGWAGFIDITPDMVPVIDGSAVDGLVISAGYSGHGLGIAPAAGRLTADLALGQPGAAAEAEPFRLRRFDERPPWEVVPSSLV